MRIYQFGFDLGFAVFWIGVKPARFASRVGPLLLQVGQEKTVDPLDLLQFFSDGFYLRDGWRVFRSIPRV